MLDQKSVVSEDCGTKATTSEQEDKSMRGRARMHRPCKNKLISAERQSGGTDTPRVVHTQRVYQILMGFVRGEQKLLLETLSPCDA